MGAYEQNTGRIYLFIVVNLTRSIFEVKEDVLSQPHCHIGYVQATLFGSTGEMLAALQYLRKVALPRVNRWVKPKQKLKQIIIILNKTNKNLNLT